MKKMDLRSRDLPAAAMRGQSGALLSALSPAEREQYISGFETRSRLGRNAENTVEREDFMQNVQNQTGFLY